MHLLLVTADPSPSGELPAILAVSPLIGSGRSDGIFQFGIGILPGHRPAARRSLQHIGGLDVIAPIHRASDIAADEPTDDGATHDGGGAAVALANMAADKGSERGADQAAREGVVAVEIDVVTAYHMDAALDDGPHIAGPRTVDHDLAVLVPVAMGRGPDRRRVPLYGTVDLGVVASLVASAAVTPVSHLLGDMLGARIAGPGLTAVVIAAGVRRCGHE